MSDAVNDHKVATILNCVENGLSPSETAEVFRKQARVLNACCDAMIEEMCEKQALTSWKTKVPLGLLAAGLILPPVAAGMLGKQVGQQAAKTLTPVNETPVSTVQKADEILRMRSETANILARVEENKNRDKEKNNDRSVRSIVSF